MFSEGLTRGARLFKQVSRLQPGEHLRVDSRVMLDCEVPANPLDKQTDEFIANWIGERLPFAVRISRDGFADGRWIIFHRPA